MVLTKGMVDEGNALKFDGINDYVQTPLSIDISQNFSFSFIFKTFDTSNQRLLTNIDLNNVNSIGGFNIVPNVFGGFYFCIYSGSMGGGSDANSCAIYTQEQILPNTTYHVVVVKNTQTRSNWRIYINGVEAPILTFGAFNTAIGTMTGNLLRIGKMDDIFPRHFNGIIWDLKIFSKVLDLSEVTELYTSKGNNVPATAQSSLMVNYRFNQNEGNILPDVANGNNGILNGFANTNLGSGNAWVDKNEVSISTPLSLKNGVLLLNNKVVNRV